MDSTVYLAGCRMNGLAGSLDLVAANLANADTPGYKRRVGRFQAALTAARGGGGGGGTCAPHWPTLAGPETDFSQGPVRRTGRPLDLAISGRGFFVLETPAGPRYTRKGRLYLNRDGELTDGAGNRFAAEGGSLSIPAGAGGITVDASGGLTAGGQELGRLRLVEFADASVLRPEGRGSFRNDGPPARPAADSRVVQGAIEESNVNPVQEMVALVTVMRAYEAAARIIKRSDNLNGQLVKSAA